MKRLQVDHLWQNGEWLSPATIAIDNKGLIVDISQRRDQDSSGCQKLSGALVPSFVNAHSHSFQFLIAGLAEHNQTNSGDFWGWRDLMYQSLRYLTPERYEAAASQLFTLMLRYGYTHVVEFHYVHHDTNGRAYSSPLAMAEALIAAARKTGMKLTLVPVYYNQASFDQPIARSQRRFYFANINNYQKFVADLNTAYRSDRSLIIGSGVHSLRAASQDDLQQLLKNPPAAGPCHLHIAEQTKEVNDCLDAWGKRPVSWLLDHITLSRQHALVHATHLTEDECRALGTAEACVVLCPSTEANLGDGIFPFRDFANHGGNWAIGSDSQVGLDPWEELRWLDYAQRLALRQRHYRNYRGCQEQGTYLCQQAWIGGRQAAGLHDQPLTPGQPFDAILLQTNDPRLSHRAPDKFLSSVVFTGGSDLVTSVWVDGQPVWEKSQQGLSEQRAQPAFLELLNNEFK